MKEPVESGSIRGHRAVVAVGDARVALESDGRRIVGVTLLAAGPASGAGAPDRDAVLARACREVRAYLAGGLRRFTVPFDQPGPDFYRQVWAALGSVGFGRTLTYGALAGLAGRAGAARAVGGAMGRNRLPLLVPCHRVVASDGLGGFGYGPAWKRRLLRLEGSLR